MKKIYSLKQNFALSLAFLFFTYYNQAQTNIFPSTGSAGIGTTTPKAFSILNHSDKCQCVYAPRMELLR